VAWGLVNFGLLLWLPAELVAEGYSVGVSSQLLAKSALIAFPTVFVCAFLYSRWSTKWSLAATIAVSALGVAGVLTIENGVSPVLPVALMIIGTNGLLAILLPYAAESYPAAVRGRATGWVAACSKSGGLIAQLLGIWRGAAAEDRRPDDHRAPGPGPGPDGAGSGPRRAAGPAGPAGTRRAP
jgi:putative MFS transporter